MTTTVPEGTGLDQRRETIERAYEASVAARTARREADEAEQMAGALADRRAAADGLVADTRRRLHAVRLGRPVMIALAVRGRLGQERATRAAAFVAATDDRDGVVAKVHGYLAQAAAGRRTAESLAVQAAALPRMLDEIALLVRAEGGTVAGRLADSEAAIIPMLQREVMCTSRLEQGRRVQDGLHRALDTLASAYAWASYDRRFGGTTTSGAAPGSAGPTAASADAGRLSGSGSGSAGDSDALEVAVQDLLAQLADAAHVVHGLSSVDAELQIGASPGGVQALLRIARATLLQVGGECERLEAQRAQALHDLAAARAVRTAILRGVI